MKCTRDPKVRPAHCERDYSRITGPIAHVLPWSEQSIVLVQKLGGLSIAL